MPERPDIEATLKRLKSKRRDQENIWGDVPSLIGDAIKVIEYLKNLPCEGCIDDGADERRCDECTRFYYDQFREVEKSNGGDSNDR